MSYTYYKTVYYNLSGTLYLRGDATKGEVNTKYKNKNLHQVTELQNTITELKIDTMWGHSGRGASGIDVRLIGKLDGVVATFFINKDNLMSLLENAELHNHTFNGQFALVFDGKHKYQITKMTQEKKDELKEEYHQKQQQEQTKQEQHKQLVKNMRTDLRNAVKGGKVVRVRLLGKYNNWKEVYYIGRKWGSYCSGGNSQTLSDYDIDTKRDDFVIQYQHYNYKKNRGVVVELYRLNFHKYRAYEIIETNLTLEDIVEEVKINLKTLTPLKRHTEYRGLYQKHTSRLIGLTSLADTEEESLKKAEEAINWLKTNDSGVQIYMNRPEIFT